VIRAALVLIFIAALAVALSAIVGEPGHASLEWLGWRLDMTAAAALLIVLLGALAAMAFWRTLLWVLQAPQRAARARAEARRRQGSEILTRGFLAAAAGDGGEARRCALKAADLVEDTPALVRVLAAQAAEASGDLEGAEAAYSAMLGFPEMRLAGHRGLMTIALAQGDKADALGHAEAAYAMARTARWAWQAVLEARLEAGDWAGALDLVKGALERKIVPPLVAERTRAALLAASAAGLEHQARAAGDDRLRDKALDQATEAARLRPGFAPGVVMAARLSNAQGKSSRAAALIENAWKVEPHPALWLAYRDLNTSETPQARAERLRDLAELNPDNRESRILMAEQALIVGDVQAALAIAEPLAHSEPTARTQGLMARAALAARNPDEARAWTARAKAAAPDPDWSDLDPEGAAFDYTAQDWARLVAQYAETGELIHPRLERHERVMHDLPDLPEGYRGSAPFLRAPPLSPNGMAPLSAPPPPDVPSGPDFDDAEEDAADPLPAPRRKGRAK
jgi:HemY protein